MRVFLDFEASSLGKQGVPVEVAWVWEDGTGESHLIRPAPGWTDWDEEAAAIHRIPRQTLQDRGTPHDEVAQRMVTVLTGHDLLASAPSWDGKWLSALLRAAGLPRHALRLRDTDDARAEAAEAALSTVPPGPAREAALRDALAEDGERKTPAHRALPDAQAERDRWIAVRDAAEAAAARLSRAA